MGDTIQSIARRQHKKTENRHFDLPASSFWKGLPGKKSTYQMRERAHTQRPLSQSAFPKFHPPPLHHPVAISNSQLYTLCEGVSALTQFSTGTPLIPLRLNFLPSKQQSLTFFGSRDWLHGRQSFHGPGEGCDGFRVIQVYYIYCAVYFFYYYISSTSDHQALDPTGWGPLL